jgi:oxygen-independent coproporphyrinogen-3 oxidase
VENFSDSILEENGRAHLSGEVYRAYDWIRQANFPQVNIDLIAGMVGESWHNWRDCIKRTLELAPDSVTIYQMELPFNTVYSMSVRQDDAPIAVADWATKRAWVDYAFGELEAAGYSVSSAYTMVRDGEHGKFLYRDSLWHGADMIGTGVASFSHVSNVHYQNCDQWDDYLTRLRDGQLPIARALVLTEHQRLIRELILQLKLGQIDTGYFRNKFGVNVSEEFRDAFGKWESEQMMTKTTHHVRLTRNGLLQVDRLLPEFFEPQHRGVRYT